MELLLLDTYQKLSEFWERRKEENIVSCRCCKSLPVMIRQTDMTA